MGEQGIRWGGMSSVPPSPALTHRSAHLQLYLCGCSMSMCVGQGGQRCYRGWLWEPALAFSLGRPLFTWARADWCCCDEVTWQSSRGSHGLLFTWNRVMRTGVRWQTSSAAMWTTVHAHTHKWPCTHRDTCTEADTDRRARSKNDWSMQPSFTLHCGSVSPLHGQDGK